MLKPVEEVCGNVKGAWCDRSKPESLAVPISLDQAPLALVEHY